MFWWKTIDGVYNSHDGVFLLFLNCLMSPNTSDWWKVQSVSVQIWKNTSQLKLQLPKATQLVYNTFLRCCWDQCHFPFPHRWRNWDKRCWSALNSRCQVIRIHPVGSCLTPHPLLLHQQGRTLPSPFPWKYLKCGSFLSPQAWIRTLAAFPGPVGKCSWCDLHLSFRDTFYEVKHELGGATGSQCKQREWGVRNVPSWQPGCTLETMARWSWSALAS